MPIIHPLLVHFPIAILTVSFLFEMISLMRSSPDVSRAAWWLHMVGTTGLLLSVASGLYARSATPISAQAMEYAENHQQIALVVTCVFAGLLFWRIAGRSALPRIGRTAYYALFGVGVALMWLGAWYGGELVYRFGVGVGSP
jgi:uncharacterized membrane protein